MMDILLEPLQYAFIQRALLTAVFIGITGAVMGSFLLVKRWSLLGDAISHAVLPGVALAYLWGMPYFIGAVATALLTSVGISFVEQHSRIKSDAAMGIMFISAFALGLAIISRAAGQVDLFHIMFGNILGVSPSDLWVAAVTGLLVLLVVVLLYKELLLWAFDPVAAEVMGFPVRGLHYAMMLLLSVTIVASLQAVGIVLVVAMLITPAATAFLLVRRFGPMMVVASVLGVTAAVIGLYLSYYWNLASGATMVLVSTAMFFLALLLSPQEGLLWQTLSRRRRALRVAGEDYLKVLHDLSAAGTEPVPMALLAERMGEPESLVRRRIQYLQRQGFVAPAVAADGTPAVALTGEGTMRARFIIRSHRLWERYLAEKGGMPWHAVHAEAHALEHLTEPPELDRMEEVLGYPRHDPHGAPIPTREGSLPDDPSVPLTEAEPRTPLTVVRVEDEDPAVLRRLADLGIVPGRRLEVKSGDGDRVLVLVTGAEHTLEPYLAAEIFVRPAGSGNRS
ncbi:MAG TPA: metal ABC transporter permease [Sphingobacteriaceae bacterium]|nr:metal ABC transporter permease [Sphingobacteriaceae bacterium]